MPTSTWREEIDVEQWMRLEEWVSPTAYCTCEGTELTNNMLPGGVCGAETGTQSSWCGGWSPLPLYPFQFTLLCNRHRRPSPEFSIFPHWSSLPINHELLLLRPPAPGSPHLLSLSVNLSTLPQRSGVRRCLCFGDWLMSLSTVSSRAMHTEGVSEFPSFLRLDDIPLHKYTMFWLPIYLSGDSLPAFGYCE